MRYPLVFLNTFMYTLMQIRSGCISVYPPTISFTGDQVLPHLIKSEPIWKMPTFFTPLIGREEDVNTVCALLQQPEVRVLTLLGIGGIGKTRLAIQIATHLRAYFTDGACFVGLSAVNDPEQVIPTIAEELGILKTKEQSLFEHVQVALQARCF